MLKEYEAVCETNRAIWYDFMRISRENEQPEICWELSLAIYRRLEENSRCGFPISLHSGPNRI
jgi:hypothetical protein